MSVMDEERLSDVAEMRSSLCDTRSLHHENLFTAAARRGDRRGSLRSSEENNIPAVVISSKKHLKISVHKVQTVGEEI